jgi:hypothetical protein
VVCLRSAGSSDTPAVQDVFKIHAKATGVPLDTYLAESGRGTLLGRLPMLAEVASVATLLASDRASALTGTYINVTCGSRVDECTACEIRSSIRIRERMIEAAPVRCMRSSTERMDVQTPAHIRTKAWVR